MAAIAIYSYAQGTPYNAFRATDSNKNICGAKGTDAYDYTYSYFYNPTSMDNRVCVKQCPSYNNGALSTLSCYGSKSCTYTATINSDGSANSSSTSTDFIGYGSYSVLGRICLP